MSPSSTSAPAPGSAIIAMPNRIETTPVSPSMMLSSRSSGAAKAPQIAKIPSVIA
jgi:hypothetical protein